jgi:hypothetical protein
MNQATGVVYKKAEDPANDKYDCDQIKDASHFDSVFGDA